MADRQQVYKARVRVGICTFLCVLALAGCSGDRETGDGGNTVAPPPQPSPPMQVRIEGRVDDGLSRSPIAHAVCRLVNRSGAELATVTADANGVYSVSVEPGVTGFLDCHPPGLSGLRLSTFVFTQGQQPGASLREDVTPATFVIASILRRTTPTDPQSIKTQLLAAVAAQDPNSSLLVDAMTILFNALLEARLDTDLEAAWSDLTADGNVDTPALQRLAASVQQAVRNAERRRGVDVVQVFARLTGSNIAPRVRIEGVVDDGLSASPIANALCSFVDQQGMHQDTAIADINGIFQLEVPPGSQGFVRCHPPALPNLLLSTFVSTQGTVAGAIVAQADVTPATTMVANIIAAEAPADPQARKTELLATLAAQEPAVTLLVEVATALYNALRESQANIDFDGSAESGSSDPGSSPDTGADGGAGGDVGDGSEARSPLPSAVCEFALRVEGPVFINAALADLLADGTLDRQDLQAIAPRVNQRFATRTAQVTAAFTTLLARGLGQPLRITAEDANSPTPGRYFLPTPSGVPGFVRCHPPGADNLVLSTFVRARQPGETLLGQDVTPGTTVISNAVATSIQADPALDPASIKQALVEAIDFRIFPAEDVNGNGRLDPGEDVNGNGVLDVVLNVVPQASQVPLANSDVALLVLTATTTFTAMQAAATALPPSITFQNALADFFSDGSFRGELAPLTPTVENTIIAPVNQAVLETEDVVTASTTGTLRGTVVDETGRALAGARVIAVQNGAEVDNTTTAGDGTFTLRDMPAGTTTLSASLMGFESNTSLVTAVAVAIIDTRIVLSPLLSFPDFSDTTRLRFIGDATQVGGVLRLRGGIGWFVVQQFLQDGFETTFQFRITDLAGVLDCEGRNGADGFALVIQNQSLTAAGGGGGQLGYGFIPNSVAIEFDTWCNSDIADPNGNHISVHTRGTEPNNADQAFALGTTTALPDMSDGNIHTVKITYVPGTLRVFLDNLVTPVLQVSIDLATTLRLDEGRAWLGFTAGVAGGTENHDILAWSFTRDGGPEPEFVSLRSPMDAACTGLTVTFQWSIENPQVGVTYCSEILTDKGQNPFDGRFEDRFPAGQARALQVSLDPGRYDPASFDWGVRVTACDTPGAACPCQGVAFDSEIRRLRTNATGQNCPP